jgi:hypothetical protein
MTPKRPIERAPDDQEDQVALYPDLPFEADVAALLAVDHRGGDARWRRGLSL